MGVSALDADIIEKSSNNPVTARIVTLYKMNLFTYLDLKFTQEGRHTSEMWVRTLPIISINVSSKFEKKHSEQNYNVSPSLLYGSNYSGLMYSVLIVAIGLHQFSVYLDRDKLCPK